MKVLLINPGRKDYIVNFFLSLKKKYKLTIFLIDPDKNIPAFQVSSFTRNYICPKVKDSKKFFSYLKNFIKKNKIDVVFPISDRELKVLAINKLSLLKNGVNVIISDMAVIEKCQNKIRCYSHLKKFDISFPEIFIKKNIKDNLPVIKKEINGSGSKNQEIISNTDQMRKKYNKKFFFQKFLDYEEYNMDILNDLKGNYLHCCVKRKLSIRSGDTDKAKIVENKIFETFAKKISQILRHIGVIDVDFLFNKKKIYLLDINPRFGGGYPFTHLYGHNYIDKILSMIKYPNKKILFKKKKSHDIVFSKGISIYKNL